MSKVFVVEYDNGAVRKWKPNAKYLAKFNGDELAAINSVKDKPWTVKHPEYPEAVLVSKEIMDLSAFPDRTFRDAWVKGDKKVSVDMPKARVIHMDRIRMQREAAFEQLDDDRRNAYGNQAALDTLETRRVLLKDIPQTSQEATDIVNAVTPEELDTIWPTDLLGTRIPQ